MSTAVELHELNLVSSSKLKLRATARLAEGTEELVFEACVLFHEAARLERRAVESLAVCPPETRLAGSIEECWCLLEGRDPPAAADVWSRILDEADGVPRATAAAMLSRVRPFYDRTIREWVATIDGRPLLSRAGQTRVLVPASAADQKRIVQDVRDVLGPYPGIAALWAGLAQLAQVLKDDELAWDSVRRAIELAPDSGALRAISLLTAAEALTLTQADRYLAEVRPELHSAPAEVCLMYAFAEIQLAQRSRDSRVERYKRAQHAVNTAFPRVKQEWVRKHLDGVSRFLESAIARREADPDLLYRAGLGRLAATSGAKPIDALRADAMRALFGATVAA